MKKTNVKKLKESCRQYTNIVGIDPSTTCTGICVNGKLYSISVYDLAYTKKGKLKKWYEIADSESDNRTIVGRQPKKEYSDEELSKLNFYSEFSDKVISIIDNENLDPSDTVIAMEGYSYGSAAGNLIDLVTFSSLIRSELSYSGYNLKIVSPATLKLASAKLAYPVTKIPLNKAKTRFKETWVNSDDVPGGKFKKPDMMQAIIDSDLTDSPWKDFLKINYSDLLEMKGIPKPIEDLNDAFLLYSVTKHNIL